MKLGRKTGAQDDNGKKPGTESDAPGGGSNLPNVAKPTASRARTRNKTSTPKRGYLDGQMLIAMPTMGDERFARSVIYVCAHSSEGAMGIIVNHPAAHVSFPDLLVQLEVVGASELIQLPPHAGDVKVLKGGPVETGRGFVLHSSDFFIENSTLPIDEGVCLTATLDILKAIARGTRAAQRGARARLCGLGARPARERDPSEWLAALRRRPRTDLRAGHRAQISAAGPEEDRHQPRHALSEAGHA